jgi:hypothetical protein
MLFIPLFSSHAFALCSSPSGAESQTRYDFTGHKMYYCDGTNWVEGGGSAASMTCPSGFTKMEAQGRTIGCIHTAAQAAATYINANLNCYNNFGGTLPTHSIRAIAQSSSLAITVAANEWVGGGLGGEGQCPRINPDGTAASSACGNSQVYRCFIAAGGSGVVTTPVRKYSDVTASRSDATTYTNTLAYEIFVTIDYSGTNANLHVSINEGQPNSSWIEAPANISKGTFSFFVPAGQTYKVAVYGDTINKWYEYK